ncbi:MAG: zinc-binding alcohol dehydrogenase family protein [Candidatus Nitronauta litoralis]|uniref:Zinc-binding alcohol dehydrogenase family protein n=1 Tax=Candidatus Nitronauta litoralis TaxID=2705533 RepID=A0A7T0G1E4_9BACT|nr:MAG: zinc-binding alcohol dehydrogenase family protein [Candidatus Nitronauta litoralis]
MKSIIVTGTGSAESFQTVETPTPLPEEKQVLIDLKATGLNWSEVMIRRGDWAVSLDEGMVLGAEGAGIVEGVGGSVLSTRPGDRVAVFDIDSYLQAGQGTYASHILVDESKVLKIPAHLDFAQAASLPMALLTAYDAMVCHSPLPETGNIVVTACTGAVGIAAMQLARMKGLRVVGTTRDENKVDQVRALGCEVVVGKDPKEICEKVSSCLGDEGVNYVFDPVQGPLAESLLELMAMDGTYVVYGNLMGSGFSLSPTFLFQQTRVHGYVVLKNLADPEAMQEVWSEIYPLIEEKLIEVPVAKTIPFPDAGAAQATMEAHQHFGKIVMIQ